LRRTRIAGIVYLNVTAVSPRYRLGSRLSAVLRLVLYLPVLSSYSMLNVLGYSNTII